MKKYLILCLFLIVLIFNYCYGSLLVSKIFGSEDEYLIGLSCSKSRVDCEDRYFKEYLNHINDLNKEDRTFFSDLIIEYDHIGYNGNCPCPYNRDERGGECGRRSSYSKNGQISYCYDSDVSDNQVLLKKESVILAIEKELDSKIHKNLMVYYKPYNYLIIFIIFSFLFLRYKKL